MAASERGAVALAVARDVRVYAAKEGREPASPERFAERLDGDGSEVEARTNFCLGPSDDGF